MATKKDNADALHKALGVTIDPEASKPNAATLQDWADRAATDADLVKREVLTSQLEARLDIQIPGDHTADQLAEWLANDDDEAIKAAIAGGAGTPPDPTPADPKPAPIDESLLTLSVRVSPRIAAYGGTYTDPDQPEGHRVIGEEPVKVMPSGLIHAGLKNGTLTEED